MIAWRRFARRTTVQFHLNRARADQLRMYPTVPDVIEYSTGFTKADQRGGRVDRHDTRQYLIRVKSSGADSPTDFERSLNPLNSLPPYEPPTPIVLSSYRPLSASFSPTFASFSCSSKSEAFGSINRTL